VESWENLPFEIDEKDRDAGGVFHDGSVYIVRNKIPSTRRAEQVIAHEVFGHLAPEVAGGQAFQDLLDWLVKNEPTAVGKTARELKVSNRVAAKEIIARVGQNKRAYNPGFVDRLLQQVREWLGKHGFTIFTKHKGVPIERFLKEVADAYRNGYYTPTEAFEDTLFSKEPNESRKDTNVKWAARTWLEQQKQNVEAFKDFIESEAKEYTGKENPTMEDFKAWKDKRAFMNQIKDPLKEKAYQRTVSAFASFARLERLIYKNILSSDEDARWLVSQESDLVNKYIKDNKDAEGKGKPILIAAQEIMDQIESGKGSYDTKVVEKVKKYFKDERKQGISIQDSAGYLADFSDIAQTVENFLSHGVLVRHKKDKRGRKQFRQIEYRAVLDVFNSLEKVGKLEDWALWKIGKRGKELMGENREKLLTEKNIERYEALLKDDATIKLFKEAEEDYNVATDIVLDFAVDSGVLPAKLRESFKDKMDYIPFYRYDKSTSDVIGPLGKRGFEGASSGVRRLTGGTNPLADPLNNIVMNYSHLIAASLNNNVSTLAVDNILVDTKIAHDEGRKVRVNRNEYLEKAPPSFRPQAIVMKDLIKKLQELGFDIKTDPFSDSELEQQVIDAGGDLVKSGYPKLPFSPDQLQMLVNFIVPDDPKEYGRNKELISIRRDGKREWYRVKDPDLYKSFTSITKVDFHPWFSPFQIAKRIKTFGVTIAPAFQVANSFRDAFSTYVIAGYNKVTGKGVPYTPWKSVSGFIDSLNESETYKRFAYANSFFEGGFTQTDNPNVNQRKIRGLMSKLSRSERKLLLSDPGSYAKVWDGLMRLRSASENASRMGVIEAALDMGVGDYEAALMGKDVLNFHRRGDARAMQYLVGMVPFLNARIQGADKLGRGFLNDKSGFVKRGLIRISLASASLAFINSGDEDYEKLPEWEKDVYWHLKIAPGYYIRLPKPFEVGLLFGTIPDRMVRLAITRDDDIGDTARAAWHAVTETMALDPMPQLFNPYYETEINKNRFTERRIMPDYMKTLDADQQYTVWDSPSVVAMGKKLGISPKKTQHMIRGYLGEVGVWGMAMSDWITSGKPERPASKWMTEDNILWGRFVRSTKNPRVIKQQEEFYEALDKATNAYHALNNLKKERNKDFIKEFLQRNKGTLKSRLPLIRIKNKVQKLSKKAATIMRSNKSAALKRKQLDAINVKRQAQYLKAEKLIKKYQ